MDDKFVEISKLKDLIRQILSMDEDKDLLINELKEKNDQLNSEVAEKSKIINELKDKTDTLKIAKSISLSDDDKSDVKNKINKIVREIDKSIGLLNE